MNQEFNIKRRATVRLTLDEIPDILKNPVLLFNYLEEESKIVNLSPLGVGLIIDKNSTISKGDIFFLKYFFPESDIRCVCVFSDEAEDKKTIGAYFTSHADQKLILGYLHSQNESQSDK